MHLTTDGESHEFINVKAYRQQHGLPETFSVALFEPKDFTGLAAIDKAGAEMNELRQAILDTVPEKLTIANVLATADTLQELFRNGLYGINERIGLKVVEVEYAVAGFGDVLRNWVYALIRAQSARVEPPDFQQVYHDWLNSSARLSQRVHDYDHRQQQWQVQIVNNAYGRVGLRVQRGDMVDYVDDGVYACPAEGYMTVLLAEIAARFAVGLVTSD
ncbi:MAG: hypothetical protein L0154_04120 [Chloroflexi bacterium]|nr:hypothetical protein [Chloroflexota bacterium]